MDNRERLEKLTARYNEIGTEFGEIEKKINDFETSDAYVEYESYTEDEVKKDFFPAEYALYERRGELLKKLEPFGREVQKAATELYKEITKNILELEKKLEINDKYLEKLNAEIEELKSTIEGIKQSEAYRLGLIQVQDLEEQLQQKITHRDEYEKITRESREKLGNLKKEQEELVEEYGKDIIQEVEVQDKTEIPGNTEPEKVETKDEKEAPASTEPEKVETKVVKEAPASTEPKKVESKAEKEVPANTEHKEEKPKTEEELKKEFKEVYKRAKRKKISKEDFDKLAEIMTLAENYDKYKITTRGFGNKAKKIVRAMDVYSDNLSNEEEKNAAKASVETVIDTCRAVAESRKQKRLAWLFEEEKPQLGEAPEGPAIEDEETVEKKKEPITKEKALEYAKAFLAENGYRHENGKFYDSRGVEMEPKEINKLWVPYLKQKGVDVPTTPQTSIEENEQENLAGPVNIEEPEVISDRGESGGMLSDVADKVVPPDEVAKEDAKAIASEAAPEQSDKVISEEELNI